MRKKGQGPTKQSADDVSTANTVAMRPATPNDYAIVATVRSLQNLVNIESKWKYRVQDAERSFTMNHSKIEKISATIENSKECLAKITAELEELIASLPSSVKVDPAHAILPGGSAGPGRKSKANVMNTSLLATGEENPVAVAQRRVREESAAMGIVMRAFYSAPRLTKERPGPPPDTPMEMRRELEEVGRITSPDLTLAASFRPPPPAPKKPVAKPTKDAKKGVVEQEPGPERMYGLLPTDVFSLPRPSCLNPQLFQKVMLLRSRRLRVEASIEMLETELLPLKKRSDCLHNMQSLGGYSIHAVTPLIAAGYDEEIALQKIRMQEDEAFSKRMKSGGK
jgi:hypothetical protein